MKMCWVTIHVADMERSLEFYRNILGLDLNRKMQPSQQMEIAFLGQHETQIELVHDTQHTEVSFSEDLSLGFQVDSLDEFEKRLTIHNIPIHAGPFQPSPAIRFFYILDPDGVKIQLVEQIT
ncbi:MAG: VOC family protein [Spirochaetota bacterium]